MPLGCSFAADTNLHFLLITVGSHGDVHPFVGMGIALRERGHQVTLATNDHFEKMIRAAGLDFIASTKGEEYLEALKDPDIWHRTRGFKVVFERGIVPSVEPIYRLIVERYIPGETVVVAHAIALGARVAQEKLGVPLVTVHLAPVPLRSHIAPPILPGAGILQWLPRWMIPGFWWFADRFVLDPVLGRPLNEFREKLGLAPARSIIGDWWMSPQRVIGLFPDWFAPPPVDWPPQLKLTGFPMFDEGGQIALSPELEAFLAAGTPPIAFTFGSAMLHAEDHFRESAEACRQLGRRGLLLTRHPDQLPRRPGPSWRDRNDRAGAGSRRAAAHLSLRPRSAGQCRAGTATRGRSVNQRQAIPGGENRQGDEEIAR
jgi:rhamnosyltransferase subunit B